MIEHHKGLIEKIYSPLFDELTAGQKKLAESVGSQAMDRTEWNKIHQQHLSHWIPKTTAALLDDVYSRESQLPTQFSSAQRDVLNTLNNYLRSHWTGSEWLSVLLSPNSSETGVYYNSTPYQKITVGGQLVRPILLGEAIPNDPRLVWAFDILREHLNLSFTTLNGLVQELSGAVSNDESVRTFKSTLSHCRNEID
jgi:hypothetical protein